MDSQRKELDRLTRLKRRAKNILSGSHNKLTGTQLSEISAIEWAIPILEQYLIDKYGELLPERYVGHKHERFFQLAQIVDRDGSNCYICGNVVNREDMSIDHVVPLSKGGQDKIKNMRLTHLACNLEKSDRIVKEIVNVS